MKRTHTCGELRPQHVGQTVTLCGWVEHWRDHKAMIFIDLRDRYGVTQVVFDQDSGEELIQIARTLRSQWVIAATGRVTQRPEGTENPKLVTGEIEIRVRSLEILNRSQTPPLDPASPELPGEELRLRYRYLDLRRPAMQRVLELRHRMCKQIRDYFDRLGFLEVETPMLARSTPEGARDYLVPSRISPGSFYALPQSPQLFKQLLMVAGCDRYVQIARCFRDEDLRADRQPEFTQLDMEMSFVEADDVMNVIDGLAAELMGALKGQTLSLPLPRLCYREAMDRYGTDKPDLRFGMEIRDLSDLSGQTEFQVLQKAVEGGGCIRGLCAPAASERYTRTQLDQQFPRFVQEQGGKGIVWLKVESDGLASPTARFFPEAVQKQIIRRFDAKPGDLILLVADQFPITCRVLDALRQRFGRELKLYDPEQLHFSWVWQFPLLAWDEQEGRWVAEHHPFTSPMPEDLEKLESDPGAVRAQAYDLVINGYEAGSGSIRIHDPQLQQRVFNLLGIDRQRAEERFGFLLEAFRYGAPPHGGIALGLDRWVMLFSGLDNIRDCIAFPKTQKAADSLTGAPAPVDLVQLKELGIILKS